MADNRDDWKKKGMAIGAVVLLLITAAALYLRSAKAQPQVNSSLAYYSDDDGKTWFTDKAMLFPPFDHNGKTAVSAHIYTYAGGTKQFCAYLSKYTDDAKRKLEASSAQAIARGDATGAPAIFADPVFLQSSGMVKRPGAGNPWVATADPRSTDVCAVHSPDGSAVDAAVIY